MTEKGYFGQFGGSFVPEQIQVLLDQLEETFEQYRNDPEFLAEYQAYLKDYAGRETPLYFAESLSKELGGAKIYLKQEDLNHLGSHKLNNVLGQILLAKRKNGENSSDCRNWCWSTWGCDGCCSCPLWFGL